MKIINYLVDKTLDLLEYIIKKVALVLLGTIIMLYTYVYIYW
jgi:hypothetical protein